MVQSTPVQSGQFEEEVLPILLKSAAMDLEWHKDRSGVYCACFYPANGPVIKLHINDFNNDKTLFVTEIIQTMEQFTLIVGHNLKGEDSDLYQLKRMAVHDLGLRNRLDKIPIIDTYKTFKMKLVKNMLSAMGVDYPSNSLNDIAEAVLGLGEGKLGGLSGLDIENKPPEEQLECCLKDAELVMLILQYNNWDILKVLHSIIEPTNMSFLAICNAYSSALGEGLFIENSYSTSMVPSKWKDTKIQYEAAFVLEPERGVHEDIITVDYKSLYPTIIVVNNLSSETLVCKHTECKEKGKFPIRLMWLINDGLMEKGEEPILEHWYRCIKEVGIYARIEKQLIKEKDQYKVQGNIIFEKGRKLLANSTSGMFQDIKFKFVDQRLGLVITAFGRMMLQDLIQESKKFGFEPIAGDTDSLFLRKIKGVKQRLFEFIAFAEQKYKATLEVDKEWNIILQKAKKSYFGITKQGKFVYKHMHGMRSNNTLLQKELMSKVVNKQILELYKDNKELARQQIIKDVHTIFDKAENEDLTKRIFKFTASRPLNEYKSGYQHEVYLERKEAGLSIKANERYSYYKINPIKVSDGNGGVREKKFTSLYPDKYDMDIGKCREGLRKCVETILMAFGIDINLI